jgi:hypothetical protein
MDVGSGYHGLQDGDVVFCEELLEQKPDFVLGYA